MDVNGFLLYTKKQKDNEPECVDDANAFCLNDACFCCCCCDFCFGNIWQTFQLNGFISVLINCSFAISFATASMNRFR